MNEKLQVRSDVTEQKLGDELMLFDQKTDKVHVLNSTSAFVWNCLKEGDSPELMEQRIRAEFDAADMKDLQGLVRRALSQLVEKGLVQTVGD